MLLLLEDAETRRKTECLCVWNNYFNVDPRNICEGSNPCESELEHPLNGSASRVADHPTRIGANL